MNWKLIFTLSLFGLAMGFATSFWVTVRMEVVLWFVIFVTCAYIIARQCQEKHFSHGFMASLVNAIWVTAIHFTFYDAYINIHPEIKEMNENMPAGFNPRTMMLASGPVVGALLGLVLGLFAFLASRIVKPAHTT